MDVRRLLSLAGAVAGLALVVAAWIVLAPTQLGGSTSYTIVVGTSMEPRLHRGDLVLVRRGSDYRVGDVVAYRSDALHRNVLHRIVAERGGRFVFKGDANDFVDPGSVTRDALIGRYWLRIGGGGSVLEWLKTPSHAALIAGLAGIAFAVRGAAAGGRRRRRRGDGQAPERPAAPGPAPLPSWSAVATGAGLALLAFAALGAVALTRPATRPVPTDRLYGETGRFSYSAPAPHGAAYPDGRVHSGDAVFTKLVDRLALRFDWHLEATQPHRVHGTASLAAIVSDGAGWERRIVLRRPAPFVGDRATVRGSLHLDRLEALLAAFENTTATARSAYTVSVVPRIELAGRIAGRAVSDSFAPPLQLSLDDERLQLAPGSAGLARSRDVSGTVQAPNRLSLARLQLSLPAAKLLAGAGGALSLLVLLGSLAAGFAGGDGGEEARLRARLGGLLVRVAAEPPAERTVELARLEELARLAERYERLILHCEQTGTYVVVDDGVAYRWRAGARGPSGLARLQDIVEQAAGRPPVERRDWSTRPWAESEERRRQVS